MTERPIIFNGEEVRAILRGEKTQTRQPVKPQPIFLHEANPPRWLWAVKKWHQVEWVDKIQPLSIVDYCPFGQPGDRLWIRETFVEHPQFSELAYRAEGEEFEGGGGFTWKPKWSPPVYMPRKFSRITLEITDVRAEQVQDITEDDARAEGVDTEFRIAVARIDGGPYRHIQYHCSHRGGFANTWRKLYAKRPGFSWDANPWVWVITFKRVEG